MMRIRTKYGVWRSVKDKISRQEAEVSTAVKLRGKQNFNSYSINSIFASIKMRYEC